MCVSSRKKHDIYDRISNGVSSSSTDTLHISQAPFYLVILFHIFPRFLFFPTLYNIFSCPFPFPYAILYFHTPFSIFSRDFIFYHASSFFLNAISYFFTPFPFFRHYQIFFHAFSYFSMSLLPVFLYFSMPTPKGMIGRGKF